MRFLALFELGFEVVRLGTVLWVRLYFIINFSLSLLHLVVVTFFSLLSTWGRFHKLVILRVFVNSELLVLKHLLESVVL